MTRPHLGTMLWIDEGGAVDELERAVDEWLKVHAPDHRGHHVQVGGGAVLCRSCGMVDLTLPMQAAPVDLLAVVG